MNELRFLGLAHNEIRSIDFLGDCLELRCLILNNNNSESSFLPPNFASVVA